MNDAEPLLVTATGIRDQDEPTVKISGKVLDDESDGFRDVTVTATNAAGEVREAVTQSNGRYEIDVTPGEWVVRAMYPDWTFSPESITVTATNGAVNLNNILGISETAEPEFSVTGSVIEESGIGVFDATVTLDLPAGKLTEKTDAFGGYRFSDLTAGSYTISVKVPGTTVEPSEYAFTVVDSDVTIPPFVVTEITPQGQGKIRGEVIDTTDTGIQNVLLTFTSPGHPAYTLFTDRKGAFMVTLPEGTWTVIPIGAGYTFNPETISVTVTNGVTDIDPFIGHTEQDVTAFTISGTVLDDKGHGMNRATVTLSGPDGTSTQRTNSKGEYSFENSVPGGYTLTVNVSGSTFTPPEMSITVTDADVTVDAFVGAEEIVEEREGKIDGAVVDALGNGLADITLTLTREGFDTVTETTGNNGKYSARVQQGEWLLAPSGGGYSFSQETVTVVVGEGTTTVPDIIATSTGQKATIAGTVVDDKDKGIRDITVILAGPDGSQTVTTDNKGEYAFVGVSPGTYIVSVAGEGWTFAPESREVTVNDISLALDPFVGTEETDNSGGDNNGGNDNNNGGGNDNNNGGGSSEGRLTGTVRTSAGEDVEGVSIVMSSSDYGTVQTTTSKQGKFDAKVTEGVWTVTPSLTGYTFSPLQLTVTVGQTASTADFTAIPENTGESVYQVSGRVIDEDGDGMKNASVTLSGGFSADVKTGTDGTFTISAVPNGTYILTVSVSGRTSDPETQTVVVNGADVIAETVTARKKNAN